MLTGKVLIIGGSYFAGRSLVECLLNQGEKEIFTFNRGNIPLNLKGVTQFHGDRTSCDSILANLRPSLLYGSFDYAPWEIYFFELMEKEAPIVIPDHHPALFNFIFVEDLSAIIGQCMETKKSYDQVFNTVSPEFVSHKKFVEMLGLISGKPIKIIQKIVQIIMQERIPLPFSMDHHEVYSGDKLRKAFGFKFTPMAQGMQKTYEFYRFLKGKNKKKGRLLNGCL